MISIGNNSRKTYESQAIVQGKINEILNGIEDVKSLGIENNENNSIEKFTKDYIHNEKKMFISLFLSNQSIVTITSISLSVIMYFSGKLIINEIFSLGTYISFISYTQKLYTPIISTSAWASSIKPTFVVIDRIKEIINDETESKNAIGKKTIDKIVSIEMKNVFFSYKEKPTLKNINFLVKTGQVILIKGKNGSGKTTILRLLLGLYKNSQGYICYNNENINVFSLCSIRERISLVSQRSFIFNRTIRENILLSDFNSYSIKHYNKTIEKSGLADFINSLPQGDETIVGENGVTLSGGQIKKISIARALYRDFDVLLIDEGTANLDIESVNIIKNLINEFRKNKIIAIIDHNNNFEYTGDVIINI